MTSHKPGWLTRKRFLMALCLVAFAAVHSRMYAQDSSSTSLTASKVFAEAPLEVLDLLRPSSRLDMLDYYTQADSILSAANALGGVSRLVQVAPDYLKAEITPVSTLEIKLLQDGKRQVVMTLYTTGDDSTARDTEVRFFDSQMKPLDTGKFLKTPDLNRFFNLKGRGISRSDLKEKLPFKAVEYTVGPGDTPLKATLTTLRAISQEDRDLLTPHLIPVLTSSWEGKYKLK